jgi:hypothetical protein
MFIGNIHNYTKLVSWINKTQEPEEKLHYKHICIVIGDIGIGKTYGIQKALESSDKTIYKINDLECTNSKDFRDILNKITASNVVSQFDNIMLSQKIIWIDDFDSYIIFDRTFLHTLQNILDDQNTPAIKIILSTTSADVKHYTKFYSFGTIIQLKPPDQGDIIHFLRKTYSDLSVKSITNITECTHGNISAAIQMTELEIIHTEKKPQKKSSKKIQAIQNEPIQEYHQLVDLFNSNYNILIGRYLFDIDPWLHPLRFHENILKEFSKRIGTHYEKEYTYINILQLYCEWDQLMSYSKINDCSDIHIAIEIASYIPSNLKKFPKKKAAISTMDEFTRMFNYLSLKKKNAVALYTTDFPWISIGSYCKHFYDDKNKKKPKQKTFLRDV